ncbi:hypothetical protein PTTG_12563 [Puccinia triticina 1-1 BBBD Race 1]|uniref:Uncharacterized protein n=1 Tax=Puccinia triticina (isolate 1-1 / race 1 (BBBD)) TaxID=630390 RepID=A0A180GIU9_PUCT1|nr:hypothetical protein PTTG_12563 [Puccinia triticina 1-1 BBBD Race 1]
MDDSNAEEISDTGGEQTFDTGSEETSETGSEQISDTEGEQTSDSSSEGEDPLERLIKELQQEEDVVIQGFNGLFNKCKACVDHEPMRAHPTFNRETPYIDQMKLISNCLHSSILPELRDQFKAILPFLEPSEIHTEPGSRCKLILEIQSQLDQTVDQTISAYNSLFSEGVIPPDQTNDQLLKETKNYRLFGLHLGIKALLSNLGYCFHQSSMLLAESGISITRRTGRVESTRKSNLQSASLCEAILKAVFTWSKGSEWDTVLDSWRFSTRASIFDNLLDYIHQRITSASNPQEEPLLIPPLDERNISLAKLLIPILKLSKIFICRFSKIGMSDQPLPHFTEMCTHQLESLLNLPPRAHANLASLHSLLTENHLTREAFNRRFDAKIGLLLAQFRSVSLDLMFYVIPLIPDKDGFPVQNEYKTFLATWNTQWLTATQNAIKLARSTSINPA